MSAATFSVIMRPRLPGGWSVRACSQRTAPPIAVVHPAVAPQPQGVCAVILVRCAGQTVPLAGVANLACMGRQIKRKGSHRHPSDGGARELFPTHLQVPTFPLAHLGSRPWPPIHTGFQREPQSPQAKIVGAKDGCDAASPGLCRIPRTSIVLIGECTHAALGDHGRGQPRDTHNFMTVPHDNHKPSEAR